MEEIGLLGMPARLLVLWVFAAVLFIVYFVVTVAALVRLRRVGMSQIAKALWAAVIVFMPILGAAAALIVLTPDAQGRAAS